MNDQIADFTLEIEMLINEQKLSTMPYADFYQ